MRIIKIILVILAVSFIAIQFYPNHMPENKALGKNHILSTGLIPKDVEALLKNSCFDCHSEQTRFPWYSKIAPSSWLLASDVRRGRKNLNFSQWSGYSKRKKISQLEAIREQVSTAGMPLPVYTIIHRKARLSAEQDSTLARWTDEMTDKILE